MVNKVLVTLGGAFVAAVAVALGVDIYGHHKVAKKVGLSVDQMAKATTGEISSAMLEKAVQKAADEMTGSYLRSIKNDIIDDARSKLAEEARKAVKESSAIVEAEVRDKICDEASKINMDELKKSVRDKAEARVLDKFNGNLDDLLGKYNDSLSNIQKIYGGIADAIAKTNNNSNALRLSIGT